VAGFLILEPRFPRSILYCTTSSRERLTAICGDAEQPGRGALFRLRALEAWLNAVAPEELQGARIHDALTHVVNEVHAVCDAVGSELLGQAGPPQDQYQSQ
jgi:uncharacterized alpha-E superfamily protein